MVPDTGAAFSWKVYQQCIFGWVGDQWRCRLRCLWLIHSQRKSSCEPGISQINKRTVWLCLFSLTIKLKFHSYENPDSTEHCCFTFFSNYISYSFHKRWEHINKLNQRYIDGSQPSQSDLCQGLEEVGLVSERVMDQAVAEGDNAMREVVLRQPGHHPLLLHVWPSCHIDDQIAQILPVPAMKRIGKTDRK